MGGGYFGEEATSILFAKPVKHGLITDKISLLAAAGTIDSLHVVSAFFIAA
jgi:hypothetical protein